MSKVTAEQMKTRTKQFALRILRLYRALPKTQRTLKARLKKKQAPKPKSSSK
jgi:hypothetical protein